MILLIIVCAFSFAQNVAKAESSDGENAEYLGAARPFPLVDIRQFYNTSSYIWSYISTSGDFRCKVDHPVYEIFKEVVFTRSYIRRQQKQNVTEYLKGTFVDIDFRCQAPTIMQVTSAGPDNAHMEQMVYEDENSTCGVFLTSNQTPLANAYNYNRYYNYTICEVRYKGSKERPRRTYACDHPFLEICRPTLIYSLYENCTAGKIKPRPGRRVIPFPPEEPIELEED